MLVKPDIIIYICKQKKKHIKFTTRGPVPALL